ncbi:protein YgfX [Massilia sp. DWR3-1-1]|uniref:protein YgfX n=1 Tax=Massilia sp. DWR3-1-1 TaxID=2804559 RepID=UPI003CEA5F81
MSIAVSVPLVPSRLLRRLMRGFAGLCLAMALACALGWAGPAWLPAVSAVLCLLAGFAVLRASAVHSRARPTARTLDVVGPGGLVLTVQQGMGRTDRLQVRLLGESTLWPGLLVLRLAGAHGPLPALLLCADSVPPGQFRRLSMALRAVAARPAAEAALAGASEKYYQNH